MTYDHDNIFAKILRGEIPCDKFYESDYSLAFYDISPQAAIHILVIPKGAYSSFADFSARAQAEEVVGYLRDLGEVARRAGLEESGYRLISNHGADANQEVPHFHTHICGGENMGRMLPKKQ